MQKSSATPGRRAQDVRPQSKGKNYCYFVEKHWTVAEVHDDGTFTLVTLRGKQHRIAADDPNLRLARMWERWLLRDRFPQIGDETAEANSS